MSEARRHQVLTRLLEDSRKGELRDLEFYALIFPDDPDLVTEEYHAMATAIELHDAPVLQHYEILRELGRGGQAVVYLARDERLDREVALKVLKGSALDARRRLTRFQREAQVASRLEHPHICPIFETGLENGAAFMAMRHLKGGSLKQALERTQTANAEGSRAVELDARRMVEFSAILEKVALALHAAHEVGVVHRDVKPGNIMLDEARVPYVVDFGLAVGAHEHESTLTETGDFFGTPAYMPPERLKPDAGQVDRRVDVWALGVILFEIIAGRRPFGGPTQAEVQRRVLEEEPPRLRYFHRRCPRELEIIVETALAKDPENRYATAFDFAEDLRRHRELLPIRARRRGALLRLGRWGQRNPVVALFLPAILVVLSLALVMTDDALKRSRRQSVELDAIHAERRRAADLDRAAWLIFEGEREEALATLLTLEAAGFERDWCRALRGELPLQSEPLDAALRAYLEALLRRDAGDEAGALALLEQAFLASERPRYVVHRSLRDAYRKAGQADAARVLTDAIVRLWP